VGTTVIIKMGKARYAWVTLMPMVWLVVITMTAGWQKIFSADTRVGFLSHARTLQDAIASGTMPVGIANADVARQLIFNDRLDAAVAAFFMIAVIVILASSIREWALVLRGVKPMRSTEVPFGPQPVPAGGD
jgi:carbon starvation protein